MRCRRLASSPNSLKQIRHTPTNQRSATPPRFHRREGLGVHLHSSTSFALGLLQPQWWSRTRPMPSCFALANNTGAGDRATMTPSMAWSTSSPPSTSAIACARHGAGFVSASVDAYRALGYGVTEADHKGRSGRSPFRRPARPPRRGESRTRPHGRRPARPGSSPASGQETPLGNPGAGSAEPALVCG